MAIDGLREVVTHIDDSESATERLRFAISLAAAHEAHIVGLHVVDVPVYQGVASAELPAEVYEIQRQQYLDSAAEAKSRCMPLLEASGLSFEWRDDEGATVERLCLNARRADLLLTGFESEWHGTSRGWQGQLVQLVLSAGAPVLAVPESPPATAAPRFITVGWDGGREAARAIRDALPLLRAAEQVSVACIGASTADGAEPRHLPGADLAHWLARHGVRAEAQSVSRDGLPVGTALLEWAKGQGADLLVMGAYGHSRAREWLLGGATRQVLESAALPTLFSH